MAFKIIFLCASLVSVQITYAQYLNYGNIATNGLPNNLASNAYSANSLASNAVSSNSYANSLASNSFAGNSLASNAYAGNSLTSNIYNGNNLASNAYAGTNIASIGTNLASNYNSLSSNVGSNLAANTVNYNTPPVIVGNTASAVTSVSSNNINLPAGIFEGINAANGGSFAVTSYSPIAPTGMSVFSDNLVIEGPVSVSGQLPFLGAVAIEGSVATSGQGVAGCGCGEGNVGIVNELNLGRGGYSGYNGLNPGVGVRY